MIRLVIFFSVLCLASFFDVRTRIIPDWIHLLMFLASLIPPGHMHPTGLLSAIPLLAVGMICDGIGGGDIKLTAACGLVLGFTKTYTGLTLGLCFLLLFHAGKLSFYKLIKKEMTVKEQAYPLVPFLLSGMAVSVLIGG